MINIKKGNLEIEGEMFEVMADFSTIVNRLYGLLKKHLDEKEAEEKIREYFELGLKSQEDLTKIVSTLLKDLIENILGEGEEDTDE